MQAVGAAEKVFEFIDRQSRMPLDLGKFDPPSIKGEIEFKNVSFYYPTRPDQPVLTNLNLTFPQGKVTALVGSSGGGKSSIVSLLCRSGIHGHHGSTDLVSRCSCDLQPVNTWYPW